MLIATPVLASPTFTGRNDNAIFAALKKCYFRLYASHFSRLKMLASLGLLSYYTYSAQAAARRCFLAHSI